MPELVNRIADRLRHAREESGLTQQQVADWLGIRRPGIVEMESGKRAVKSEELARLAVLYGRSIAWLTGAEPSAEDRIAGALFRTTDAADPALKREAHLLGRRCRLLSEAEKGLGIRQRQSIPDYGDASRLVDYSLAVDHGRAVAYQERQRLELGVHAPLSDVWGIVEGAGLRVFPLQLGNQHAVDGIFTVLDNDRACVGVNVDKWVFRQIFTVVHEYAHALFDRSVGGDVCNTARGWTAGRSLYANRELRANQFAAVFLIPREAMLRYLESVGKLQVRRRASPTAIDLTPVDIIRCQDHFGASAEMILWRLRNEHMISAKQRSDLLKDISVRGVTNLARSLGYDWRRRAQPVTRAQEIALAAYSKGHLSLGELSEVLGIEKSDLMERLSEWGVAQEFGEGDRLVGAAGTA